MLKAGQHHLAFDVCAALVGHPVQPPRMAAMTVVFPFPAALNKREIWRIQRNLNSPFLHDGWRIMKDLCCERMR